MAMTDAAVSAEPVQRKQAQSKVKQVPGRLWQGKARGSDGLSPRERQFIGQMCLNGFNQTQACKSLGYGGARPDVEASRIMKRPAIRAEIEKRQLAMESKVEITVDRIAAAYAKLAFAQHDGPLTASNVIQALDALGKYKGMFKPDQVTVVPVTFQFIGGPDLPVDVTPQAYTEPVPSPSTGTTDSPGIGKPVPR